MLVISMMEVSSTASTNGFACQACPYRFPIQEQSYASRLELQRKKVDDVLGGEDAWKNVDATDGTAWSFIRASALTLFCSRLSQVRIQARLLYADSNQKRRRALNNFLQMLPSGMRPSVARGIIKILNSLEHLVLDSANEQGMREHQQHCPILELCARVPSVAAKDRRRQANTSAQPSNTPRILD
mgnify:CR=1 FL=1